MITTAVDTESDMLVRRLELEKTVLEKRVQNAMRRHPNVPPVRNLSATAPFLPAEKRLKTEIAAMRSWLGTFE